MYLSADIVEKDIPLLLSKDSMKRGKMRLGFCNDNAEIFVERNWTLKCQVRVSTLYH